MDKHLKMSNECKTVAVEPHDDSSEMCYIVNKINVSEMLNVILIKGSVIMDYGLAFWPEVLFKVKTS